MRERLIKLLAACLLIIAIAEMPDGYYTFLKFAVCGGAAYLVYVNFKSEREGWLLVFGLIALMWNPLVPLQFKREIWVVLDIAAAVVFIVSSLKDSIDQG